MCRRPPALPLALPAAVLVSAPTVACATGQIRPGDDIGSGLPRAVTADAVPGTATAATAPGVTTTTTAAAKGRVRT